MGPVTSAYAIAHLFLCDAHDPAVVFVGGRIVPAGCGDPPALSWVWNRVSFLPTNLVHSGWGDAGNRVHSYRDGSDGSYPASGSIAASVIGIFRWGESGDGWSRASGLVAQSPG